ncbi:uncharacterized protein LOC144595336 [Rhinoraja longicauda]
MEKRRTTVYGSASWSIHLQSGRSKLPQPEIKASMLGQSISCDRGSRRSCGLELPKSVPNQGMLNHDVKVQRLPRLELQGRSPTGTASSMMLSPTGSRGWIPKVDPQQVAASTSMSGRSTDGYDTANKLHLRRGLK